MKNTMNRRDFIAASGLTVGLPWLEYFSGPKPAWAAPLPGFTADGSPKRLICLVNGLGSIRNEYVDGTGSNFTLRKTLQPLADQKSIMTVIKGLNQSHDRNQGAHPRGEVGALSGHELVGGNRGNFSAGDLTIDQRIADYTQPNTLRRSIHLGYCKRTVPISTRRRNQKIEPFYSPYKAFDSIFDNVMPSGGTEASPEEQMRADILNRTNEAYKKLSQSVGMEDQERLAKHIQGLDELIRRVNLTRGGQGGACSPPVIGSHQGLPGRNGRLVENYQDRSVAQLESDEPLDDAVGRSYMDIIAQSFACDVTRIATFSGGELHDHGGHSHQAVSNNRNRNPVAYDWVVRGSVNMAKRVNYLVELLKNIPDSNGKSVMDNTLILWMYSMSDGNGHNMHDSRQVLLGNAGGTFNMNRVVEVDAGKRIGHNVLLTSILNSFGVPDTRFGKPGWGDGALNGLNLNSNF